MLPHNAFDQNEPRNATLWPIKPKNPYPLAEHAEPSDHDIVTKECSETSSLGETWPDLAEPSSPQRPSRSFSLDLRLNDCLASFSLSEHIYGPLSCPLASRLSIRWRWRGCEG